MKQIWKAKSALILAGMIMFGSSLTVCAEEEIPEDAVTPPGYHVYEVQGDEASDTWYGIARGDYLLSGLAKLTEDDTGVARCSGKTFAQVDCDKVYVRIYLDQSVTGIPGDGGWHTLDYWTGYSYNDCIATAKSGPYNVARNQYYRVRGVHSVTVKVDRDGDGVEEDFTETTGTCTNALFFD